MFSSDIRIPAFSIPFEISLYLEDEKLRKHITTESSVVLSEWLKSGSSVGLLIILISVFIHKSEMKLYLNSASPLLHEMFANMIAIYSTIEWLWLDIRFRSLTNLTFPVLYIYWSFLILAFLRSSAISLGRFLRARRLISSSRPYLKVPRI